MAKQTIRSDRYPPIDGSVLFVFADGEEHEVPIRRRVPVWTVTKAIDTAAAAQFEPGSEAATVKAMMDFIGEALVPEGLTVWERFKLDEECDLRAVIGIYEDVMAAVTKRPTVPSSTSSPGSVIPVTGGYVPVPSRGEPAPASTTSGTTPEGMPESS